MSDATNALHREIQAAAALRANLADLVGDDEECLADMVEAETDLMGAIDNAVTLMITDEIAITGLDEMIAKLTSRRDRFKARKENVRTALAAALEQAGKTNFDHHAVTISLKATPPSVIITDEASIPSKYFKAAEPKLDKRAVLAALKAKEEVLGAQLSNGGTCLQVRFS